MKPLTDVSCCEGDDMIESFLQTLRNEKEFACKPCNGAGSVGFVRLSCDGDDYFINGNKTNAEGIRTFILETPNYVFTEYIRPSSQFEKYSKTIHTLRCVVVNTDGMNPRIVGGYLRLPNNHSGEANYILFDKTNIGTYNLVCKVDFDSGDFGNSKMVYCNKSVSCEVHPDTEEMIKGLIPNFEDLKTTLFYISRKFSCLEYLGFDIGITTAGFKCMEINTHPGIKYMQVFEPFNKNDRLKAYFQRKIDCIESLSFEEKQKRNRILR